MATPSRDAEPEMVSRPNKQKFKFGCNLDSDDEQMQEEQSPQRPASEEDHGLDVIQRFLSETAKEIQTEQIIADDNARTNTTQQHEEASELFVPADEDGPDIPTPPVSEPQVTQETDSNDDFMIIDVHNASKEALQRWSEPRQPWTVDLTDVKQDIMDKSFDVTCVKEEPMDESFDIRHAQRPATEDCPAGGTQSVKVRSKNGALDKRRQELAAKLLSGTLSQEDIAELAQITAQLQAEDGCASTNTPTQIDGEKKKRKAPAKNAAEYFAREQEKEEESEKKRRERGSKRASTGKAIQSSKRPKLSARQKRQLEQGAQRLQSMRGPIDAIQERAEQGELREKPVIQATRKDVQLRQMEEAVPEDADPRLIQDQIRELRRATQAWGESGCLPRDGKWKIRGMRSLMPNHQIIVGAWMLGRELKQTRDLPRGGILADAMGMGKTIETLSCIVGNQAPDDVKEAGRGATLIVCQSGQMIEQWKSEIKKHCESKKFSANVVHYKAGNKLEIDLLATFNVVLASYNQIRDGIPSTKVRQEMLGQMKDVEKYSEWLEAETGDLFQIEWLGVVLDEAHMIKNHKTHSAFSCCELKAKYRWAVSGTPLVNDALELFSYLKFLKFNIGDIGDYMREYVEADDAEQKQKQLAYDLMYRRTHSDQFLGQRILNLPNTHPTHQYLELSKEETVVYRMMERCFRRKINKDLADGMAERQILCYLVMLLRLRQASTHPFLLEGVMGEFFTLKDLEITKTRLRDLKGKQTVYEQIGTWEKRHEMSDDRIIAVYQEAERRRAEGTTKSRLDDILTRSMMHAHADSKQHPNSEDTNTGPYGAAIMDSLSAMVHDDDVDSVDEVLEDSNGMVPEEYLPGFQPDERQRPRLDEQYLDPFGLSEFGLYFDMDRQLDYLTRLGILEIAKCIVCKREPPVDAVRGKGKCEHIFCTRCLVKHFAKKGRNCPDSKCRKIVGEPVRLQGFEEEDSDGDSDSDAYSTDKPKGRKEKEYIKGFDYGGFQPYEDDKKGKKPLRFLQISDRKSDIPVTPSAKTTALKETILKWQLEAPDDKIIIFSQFNVCMKVVARMLEAEGIDFAYLSGSMTTDQRKKAVKEFEEGDTVQVLIASLRAGGTALNLTRGNRVVLMELWWNHAVEQQAFARVFRMGQTKETHFLRFIVNTDIEKRMLGMQVDKIMAIDAALQDGGPRAPKISVEDIASLLGKVVKDHSGNVIRVVADYSDEDDDEDDNQPHSATSAAALLDKEPDLPGFEVPDGQLEYEDDEDWISVSDVKNKS